VSKWLEKRSTSSTGLTWNDLMRIITGPPSHAGVVVNESNAINYSVVFACVRVIAETVASLPLHVYQRVPSGGKQRAPNHPLYDILHDLPNPEMTSFTLRETMMSHLLLWGNAYAEIEWGSDGYVRALWPIPPHCIQIERNERRQIQYRVSFPDGAQRILSEERILHIPGLSFDGLQGISPIRAARQAIGLGLAAEEFGARFFGNGTHLGGVLKHPSKLSDQAHKHLKESINEAYTGLGKSHRLMLLEEGMELEKIGIPPEDAQFLETRKFQVAEIARIFRVPPHMIGDLERATFSNIEHQSIEFVVHTIRPWLVRWEQAMKWKLFLPAERRSFFAEFVVDGLLRGDIKSRYEAYAIARQNGWMSADDIRELENMNPLPDGQGQIYLVNGNMIPVDQARMPEPTQEPPEQMRSERRALEREERAIRSATRRRQLAQAHYRLFVDAVARVVKREVQDVSRQARKLLQRRDAQSFADWLDEFYRDHPEFVRRNMTPVFMAYAEAVAMEASEEIGVEPRLDQLEEFMAAYITTFVTRYVGSSLNQLQSIIREAGEDLLAAIEQRLNEWMEKRPEKVATREVHQANNAVALAAYSMGGAMTKRWVTVGSEDCPYCRSLDGQVVGINSAFVEVGNYQPEGAETPLTVRHTIKHPPIHRGCDCMIVAGG
jgi:HK97 family phage portal protein